MIIYKTKCRLQKIMNDIINYFHNVSSIDPLFLLNFTLSHPLCLIVVLNISVHAQLWHVLFIYLFIYFIYFQFIYRWQILFHRTIRLAFHKQQGLSQTSGAINNIVECCYRWHQIFETEPQFVVRIKVNTNQNRNAKIRQYAPNWQMTLYQNDLIKTINDHGQSF